MMKNSEQQTQTDSVDEEYVGFQHYQLSDRETARLLILRGRYQDDTSGQDRAEVQS